MGIDEFSVSVKDALAKRVALRCTNPNCNKTTTGPHSDPNRSINVGVASHITAAAAGGPRFDNSLTLEQRASIDNGIWLCQSCAKLVDSDSERFSVARLKAWKVGAEARALRELKAEDAAEYFPQPPSAMHAPIPRIGGMPYEEARQLLLDAGWQPRSRHWSHGSSPNLQAGNGLYFWNKGYWEIINAWPTGLAKCTFGFHDVYGNLLTVVTMGEVLEELDATAHVQNWYFEKEA
jgi:hypothetical protein